MLKHMLVAVRARSGVLVGLEISETTTRAICTPTPPAGRATMTPSACHHCHRRRVSHLTNPPPSAPSPPSWPTSDTWPDGRRRVRSQSVGTEDRGISYEMRLCTTVSPSPIERIEVGMMIGSRNPVPSPTTSRFKIVPSRFHGTCF
jgi:hypothetical protein